MTVLWNECSQLHFGTIVWRQQLWNQEMQANSHPDRLEEIDNVSMPGFGITIYVAVRLS